MNVFFLSFTFNIILTHQTPWIVSVLLLKVFILVEGRGTWMFVRCIMKLHACIKFLSYLLSINYFMFVSFVVFGCYTADDNGGKCVYMFMTWCSLPWNTTNTGKNMLCYGRPFYPFFNEYQCMIFQEQRQLGLKSD